MQNGPNILDHFATGEASMLIKNTKDIRGENINWIDSGKRFKEFREACCMSQLEAAQEIDLSESQLATFEAGYESDHKATNIIWNICFKWNLSINWLLNGLGNPHDPDPVELMPETLISQKGAGILKNNTRKEADAGSYSDHILEFVIAIDKFKSKYQISFPPLTQIYEIVMALGYRKSVPSRIAPLGYIVEHQQVAEKFKQIKETDLDLNDKEYDKEFRLARIEGLEEKVAEIKETAKAAKAAWLVAETALLLRLSQMDDTLNSSQMKANKRDQYNTKKRERYYQKKERLSRMEKIP